MTLAETPTLESSVDRDFIERLKQLQRSELVRAYELTPRDVIARTIHLGPVQDELLRRRRQWDFDGSVVLGRIDTATAWLYVGTRRVLDDGEPLLHSIDEPAVAELWAATASDPGQVLVKRHLKVDGWTIQESTTEFDRRDERPGGDSSQENAHELGQLVAELESLQSSVVDVLRQALHLVDEGRTAPVEASLTIADWNDRLADAARAAGLDAANASLAALREQLAREQSARQQERRRREAERILEKVLRDHPELSDVLRDLMRLPDHMPLTIRDEDVDTDFEVLARQVAPQIPHGFDAGEGPWL